MTLRIKHVFCKRGLISYGLVASAGAYSFHNLVARGKATLDGYDAMAKIKTVNGELKLSKVDGWGFRFFINSSAHPKASACITFFSLQMRVHRVSHECHG